MPESQTGGICSIMEFYGNGVGCDSHGRTLKHMCKWDDEQLERCHDYIQTMFPLPEGSMFSYNASIIDKETLEAFRKDTPAQLRMCRALVRMLDFYGFQASLDLSKHTCNKEDGKQPDSNADKKETPVVEFTRTDTSDLYLGRLVNHEHGECAARWVVLRADKFEQAAKNWAVPMDHNHLRISRILRSLRVLGLKTQCLAFYEALKDVYNDPKYNISQRSMMFWTRAVREPLHIAPDGTKCEWLEKWLEENPEAD